MPELYRGEPENVKFMIYQNEKKKLLIRHVKDLIEKRIKIWNFSSQNSLFKLLLHVSNKNNWNNLNDKEKSILNKFKEKIITEDNELRIYMDNSLSIALNRIEDMKINEMRIIISSCLPVSVYEYLKEFCEQIMIHFDIMVNNYKIEIDKYLKESLRELEIDVETYNNFYK